MESIGRKANQGAPIAWIFCATMALMLVGVGDLPAQSVDVGALFADPPGALPAEAYNFIGSWSRDSQSYSRGDCGFLVDQNGIPRNNCAVVVDEMPLNERALAWIEYFDEIQSPLYSCGANTIPTLLGDVLKFNIQLKRDHIFIYYEMGGVERKVWIDGRPHPPEGEQFYQGHSIGRFVDDGLVIHSANYTFDPSGFDDHGHIATSVEKKVTEYIHIHRPESGRYRNHSGRSAVPDSALHLPSLLGQNRRSHGLALGVRCRITRREVYFANESKYSDDVRNPPRLGAN